MKKLKECVDGPCLIGAIEKLSKDYELATAVFEVRNTKYHSGHESETLCVMRYIRLEHGTSKGFAIPILRKDIEKRYKTSDVKFKFWCDSYVAGGGAPEKISAG